MIGMPSLSNSIIASLIRRVSRSFNLRARSLPDTAQSFPFCSWQKTACFNSSMLYLSYPVSFTMAPATEPLNVIPIVAPAVRAEYLVVFCQSAPIRWLMAFLATSVAGRRYLEQLVIPLALFITNLFYRRSFHFRSDLGGISHKPKPLYSIRSLNTTSLIVYR